VGRVGFGAGLKKGKKILVGKTTGITREFLQNIWIGAILIGKGLRT
jgi:hypothetical protein